MNAIKFPEWVPQWARDEIEAKTFDDTSRWMLKLIESPVMRSAWQTLDKCEKAYAKSTRAVKLPRSSLLFSIQMELIQGINKIGAEYTSKEVRVRADEITLLAKRLAKKLEPLTESVQFSSTFNGVADALQEILTDGATFTPDRLDTLEDDAFHAAIRIAYRFPTLLHSLAEGASIDAGMKSVLSRPHHSNAARLYTLGRLRELFEERYGQPLHSVNLAITSLFFDCSNLSPAAVNTITKPRGAAKRAK